MMMRCNQQVHPFTDRRCPLILHLYMLLNMRVQKWDL